MKKYRDWVVLESLPDGWIIDKTAGSPAPNTVFITNGKSVLNGQKRALLKVNSKRDVFTSKNELLKVEVVAKKNETTENVPFPAKKINTLARKRFQEHILKEILFDLTVCELEGYDKKKYIKEMKKLLNRIEI